MKYESVLVAGDFQIPFYDPRTVSLFLRFAKDLQPDKIVLNGDVMDCWEISDFVRSPFVKTKFRDEIKQTKTFLKDLRQKCPNSEITFIEGNHEFRVRKYLMYRAKELAELDELQIQTLLGLDELKIEYISNHLGANKHSDVYTRVGDLFIGHWDSIRQWGGFTAKNLLDKRGVCILQNHTHRMGSHYRTWVGEKVMGAWENGCLCDLKPSYVANPDWQQGWSCVYHKVNSLRFQVIQIPVVDYEFWFGGKHYVN